MFPPTHYRDIFPNWEQCCRYAARQFEDVIVADDPATVAGIIVEPIGNTGGVITPTDEYFRILRQICDKHNIILIFDECWTGFGKCGTMFGAQVLLPAIGASNQNSHSLQAFGTNPDIIVCGKALSNGVVPIAAMLCRRDMADAFTGDGRFFAHGHTHCWS